MLLHAPAHTVHMKIATSARCRHAGYRYCGHVMAHAYRQIDCSRVCGSPSFCDAQHHLRLHAARPKRFPDNICRARRSRVFLLGPSHHVHTRKCLLSSLNTYATPLGAPRCCNSAVCVHGCVSQGVLHMPCMPSCMAVVAQGQFCNSLGSCQSLCCAVAQRDHSAAQGQ
jgi:hypothetical protein